MDEEQTYATEVTITMPASVARSVYQAVANDPNRSKWGHHQHDRVIALRAIAAALDPHPEASHESR